MLISDVETLEDIRIVNMLLIRVYDRAMDVIGRESYITKRVDDALDATNKILDLLDEEEE